MAQFQKRTHPARQRLEALSRDARWAYDAIERRRAQGVDWPANVFCPLAVVSEIFPDAIMSALGPAAARQLLSAGPLRLAQTLDPICTMAAWRMTQGIYRIDPAVYEAVVETPIDAELPAQVLERLPEWCIYVETPGMQTERLDGRGRIDIRGAWARQDIDPAGERVIVLALDFLGETAIPHQHVPIDGTIEGGLRRIFSQWSETMQIPAAALQAAIDYTKKIFNLLLYIASTTDISRRGQPDMPKNPEPKRTRRDGWRLFPANGPSEWDVGVRMGAALRTAYQQQEAGGGGGGGSGVRPHVRRAHWHGFRSGPMKRPDGQDIPAEERKFELRWLPPIPVNVDDPSDLPAVIRRIP